MADKPSLLSNSNENCKHLSWVSFYWAFSHWSYVEELTWAHPIAIISDVSKGVSLWITKGTPITRYIPKVLWALCQELGAKVNYISYAIGYALVSDHGSLRMKASSSYRY